MYAWLAQHRLLYNPSEQASQTFYVREASNAAPGNVLVTASPVDEPGLWL